MGAASVLYRASQQTALLSNILTISVCWLPTERSISGSRAERLPAQFSKGGTESPTQNLTRRSGVKDLLLLLEAFHGLNVCGYWLLCVYWTSICWLCVCVYVLLIMVFLDNVLVQLVVRSCVLCIMSPSVVCSQLYVQLCITLYLSSVSMFLLFELICCFKKIHFIPITSAILYSFL